MNWTEKTLPSFSVIGMEGSTQDGNDTMVSTLWTHANEHFKEVVSLAKRDESGNTSVWGLMTNFARTFAPWEENFSQGFYLAGVAVDDAAEPPAGWVKWTVPGWRYRCTPMTDETTFFSALQELQTQGYTLAGAVQECFDGTSGGVLLMYPVERV